MRPGFDSWSITPAAASLLMVATNDVDNVCSPTMTHDAGGIIGMIAAHLYWTGGCGRSTEQHAGVHTVGDRCIVGH